MLAEREIPLSTVGNPPPSRVGRYKDTSAILRSGVPATMVSGWASTPSGGRPIVHTFGIVAAIEFSLTNVRREPRAPDDVPSTGDEVWTRSTSGSLPMHLAHAVDELRSYRSLTNGWDGEGSIRPDPALIDAAERFILSLPSEVVPPEPTASADGTVGLSWDDTAGYVSVVFFGRDFLHYNGNRNGITGSDKYPLRSDAIPIEFLQMIS